MELGHITNKERTNTMELPTTAELRNLNTVGRKTLGEFYDKYHTNGWFDRATITKNDAETMRPTLVVNCIYQPIHDFLLIKEFCQNNKLALKLVLPPDPDSIVGPDNQTIQTGIGADDLVSA